MPRPGPACQRQRQRGTTHSRPGPGSAPARPGASPTSDPAGAGAGVLNSMLGLLLNAAQPKPKPPAPFLESGVAFDHLAAPDTETGAVPERCVEDVAPGGKDTLLRAYERGSKLMELQQYDEAAAAYMEGLRAARSLSHKAKLAYNRSAAFAGLAQLYRSHPSRRTEGAGLFDLDPTSLGPGGDGPQNALDATCKRPEWAEAHMRLGVANFLFAHTWAAKQVFLAGLSLIALHKPLQTCLREVQARLGAAGAKGSAGGGGGGGGGGGTDHGGGGGTDHAAATDPAADPAAAATPTAATSDVATTSCGGGGGAPTAKRLLGPSAGRDALDEWDCSLCAKLLFEPVTTHCGHTFCRECLVRATGHDGECPACRTVLHVGKDEVRPSHTLASIMSRAFPEEYEERRREARGSSWAS